MRIGIGYDIHRLGADRPLILGGITVPGATGLVGHSDADPVMHAVTDALLGAAALGDIGEHFPDSDPEWENADSSKLLAHVVALIADKKGLSVVNVDINIIAQRPRLRGYKHAMRKRLAAALETLEENVSVKARTKEGLDATGHGEAIEVHAAALLEKVDR
jgi:2-C-methyl-D-erythritol 2,4-cyclodiphosphate synthase